MILVRLVRLVHPKMLQRFRWASVPRGPRHVAQVAQIAHAHLAGEEPARRKVAKSIEMGDKAIEEIVRRAAEEVGRGIGSLINILAPDVVILGGGLVEAMPKLYLESVTEGVRRNVLPSLADCAKLKVSELGDLAGATGAAAWVRQESGTKVTKKV